MGTINAFPISTIKEGVDNIPQASIDWLRGQLFATGNINAQVNHRTGTIAELLAVGDGGDGEMAQATDVPTIVHYNSAFNEPKVTPFEFVINQAGTLVLGNNNTNVALSFTANDPFVGVANRDYMQVNDTLGSALFTANRKVQVLMEVEQLVGNTDEYSVFTLQQRGTTGTGSYTTIELAVDVKPTAVGERRLLNFGFVDLSSVADIQVVAYNPSTSASTHIYGGCKLILRVGA